MSNQIHKRQTSSEGPGVFGNPGFLLLIIAGTLFFSELLIMLFLPILSNLSTEQKAFIDAFLLSFIAFPILYFLAFRPLTKHITARRLIESEKDIFIEKLDETLAEVKALRGIIPICASCKKIRDDQGYWHQVEAYVSAHSSARFSHGLCDECLKKLYPDSYEKIMAEEKSSEAGEPTSPEPTGRPRKFIEG